MGNGSDLRLAGRPPSWRRLLVAVVMGAVWVTSVLVPTPASAADRYRLEIVNGASGLRADVMWASTVAYQNVFLWTDNTSASQEFDLLDSGGGYFRIRARHSRQCLMLDPRAGLGNGNRVIQHPRCTAHPPAEWSVRRLSGTTCSGDVCRTGHDRFLLVNRHSGRCLDAANPAGGRPRARAVLQTWDCVRSASAWNIGNQSWDLLRPGTVRID